MFALYVTVLLHVGVIKDDDDDDYAIGRQKAQKYISGVAKFSNTHTPL